jgi:hypothetical protein
VAATHTIERLARRRATCMVPQPVPSQPGTRFLRNGASAPKRQPCEPR